jgi:hypothetical protein
MTRGVRKYLVGSVVLIALIAVAGCSHYMIGEREPWRRDAEAACLSSGAVKESPTRVRISSIDGPGMCGISYPLKVSSLGEAAPLGYDDEPPLPPSSIPQGAMPQHWPVVQSGSMPQQEPAVQSSSLPPLQPAAPSLAQPGAPQYGQQQYGQPQYSQPQYAQPQYRQPQYSQPQYNQPQYVTPAGAPMSLNPPGVAQPDADDADVPADSSGPMLEAVPDSGYGTPYPATATPSPAPPYTPRPESGPYSAEPVPLGPPAAPMVTAAAGPVELKPAATLACPIVSMLDQWISEAVQPAAEKWFREPVVEIKQIGSYSCRDMINGNPNAPISEHAFGNALDIAAFVLADGHTITVQYGWHGTPEEQGFLHDVQGAACQDFTTVLAPGANVYHYNHIHVDLMRRRNSRHICEPAAIPGDVVAERARARYAAQHYGNPSVTGSIKSERKSARPSAYSGDDGLPDAVPGAD